MTIELDIKTEVLRALAAGNQCLLNGIWFDRREGYGGELILIHPRFQVGLLLAGDSPHPKLAECVVLVRGARAAITHLSNSFKKEWEALRELSPA